MVYDSNKHHRRSVRLPFHNYGDAGWYFLTICAGRRGEVFGRIVEGEMQLNRFGRVVSEEWERSVSLRPEIELDEWLLMPDHLHAIIVIQFNAQAVAPVAVAALPGQRAPRSVSTFVGGFKGAATRRISALREQPTVVWQRGFHERIIRDERELNIKRRYITENPARWTTNRNP